MTVCNVFQQIVSMLCNLRHILRASCDTSVRFNIPPGLKREITLELGIHMQFNSVKVHLLNSNMIQHSSTVFYSSYIPTLLLCVLNLITNQQKQPITLSALQIFPPVLVQAVDYNLIKPIC